MAEENKAPEAPAAQTPGVSPGIVVPPKKGGGGSNKKTLIIVLVIVFVLFILPGLVFGAFALWFSKGNGAEKLTESIIEQSTGGDVDINSDDGSFSVEGEDGSFSIGNDQELPDDFPDEVETYPGQSVKGSFRSSDDESTVWSVTAESDDSVSKVNSFFADKFSSWENKGEFSINNATTTSYEKGSFSATITVSENSDTGKTSIAYNISKDK